MVLSAYDQAPTKAWRYGLAPPKASGGDHWTHQAAITYTLSRDRPVASLITTVTDDRWRMAIMSEERW